MGESTVTSSDNPDAQRQFRTALSMFAIAGSVITSLCLGLIEGLTKMFYPEGSATVVFVVMALVLLVRPSGLFGNSK